MIIAVTVAASKTKKKAMPSRYTTFSSGVVAESRHAFTTVKTTTASSKVRNSKTLRGKTFLAVCTKKHPKKGMGGGAENVVWRFFHVNTIPTTVSTA